MRTFSAGVVLFLVLLGNFNSDVSASRIHRKTVKEKELNNDFPGEMRMRQSSEIVKEEISRSEQILEEGLERAERRFLEMKSYEKKLKEDDKQIIEEEIIEEHKEEEENPPQIEADDSETDRSDRWYSLLADVRSILDDIMDSKEDTEENEKSWSKRLKESPLKELKRAVDRLPIDDSMKEDWEKRVGSLRESMESSMKNLKEKTERSMETLSNLSNDLLSGLSSNWEEFFNLEKNEKPKTEDEREECLRTITTSQLTLEPRESPHDFAISCSTAECKKCLMWLYVSANKESDEGEEKVVGEAKEKKKKMKMEEEVEEEREEDIIQAGLIP